MQYIDIELNGATLEVSYTPPTRGSWEEPGDALEVQSIDFLGFYDLELTEAEYDLEPEGGLEAREARATAAVLDHGETWDLVTELVEDSLTNA